MANCPEPFERQYQPHLRQRQRQLKGQGGLEGNRDRLVPLPQQTQAALRRCWLVPEGRHSDLARSPWHGVTGVA